METKAIREKIGKAYEDINNATDIHQVMAQTDANILIILTMMAAKLEELESNDGS